MNTPYLWFEPKDFSSRLMGDYDHDTSPDFLSYIQAKPVPAADAEPVFTFNAPRARLLRLDVLTNSILVPLISPRVASLLETLSPNDVQLIPARIQTLDGSLSGYSLLNVISQIAGIDHAHSDVTVYPGTNHIVNVTRLRYLSGAMGRHALARESERHTYLWASHALVQRFAEDKITGCSFEPPESIHP